MKFNVEKLKRKFLKCLTRTVNSGKKIKLTLPLYCNYSIFFYFIFVSNNRNRVEEARNLTKKYRKKKNPKIWVFKPV